MEFITSQSQTVQALISIVIPLIISLIPGILFPLTILKKLKTTPKIIALYSLAVNCKGLPLRELFLVIQPYFCLTKQQVH